MRSFFAVILALSASMLVSAGPPKKLVIESVYFPESCPMTSKRDDTLRVNYVGKFFHNGHTYDTNEGGAPFQFKLGSHEIQGWNEGLKE
ncbi:Peptidyl-prolyl cis-trans isomerase fpr2 [Tulasnella sp. 417]|nr:Peptidyl-prolyl cis-trans isomerase fpr2 [Tulasnella sp. 417]